jgi:hypothetical protein
MQNYLIYSVRINKYVTTVTLPHTAGLYHHACFLSYNSILPNLAYKFLKLSASNAVAVQFTVSPPSPPSCIAG